ncbi:SPOR domain-containing protein [Thiomicrorhabdus lithotrophica]|uniref:SPOR domain-containing protein n=1 Tax=Thiomicrorhabdus lithotrophica TaxID=2949997 RepID=A0ABY8CCR0_9GAMM|nr:SPOR domain-containing protein [Thiomicrorhabdus lithotrophica]WEJ61908.1 SPOR domain-containing protein [Thiomicrorhabdus lithotrophica]
MDLISKYRLVGAAIWLGLLVIIVPNWYSEPVNFVPEGIQKTEPKSTLPIVDHAYRLPQSNEQPQTNGQVQHQKEQSLNELNKSEPTNLKVDSNQKTAEEIQLHKQIETADKVSENTKYKGQWIVRLQAFQDIKAANNLLGRLDSSYDVYIKYFEKTKMYSVRTGPYLSKAKAEKDKVKLDKMLHTKSEVVQLP